MRTHSAIVTAAGIGRISEIIPGPSLHTIRSWAQRDSIPGEYWAAIAKAEIASLEELASAAAARREQAA